ncbi:uncharacterized protein LOC134821754 isoform X2 [Bolinopsis microptera]|uniref:uncharacterized protein LOC134821754 isoform X2 n=1 Tax=Bolinopsis microptera TaxID=2820187 RepID=UPI0030795EC9
MVCNPQVNQEGSRDIVERDGKLPKLKSKTPHPGITEDPSKRLMIKIPRISFSSEFSITSALSKQSFAEIEQTYKTYPKPPKKTDTPILFGLPRNQIETCTLFERYQQKRAEAARGMQIKRGTIFQGKVVPEGLHPNFNKLPRHLLIAQYSNKVNRINKIDRTMRLTEPRNKRRKYKTTNSFRFITNEQCLECHVDQASELFGSLIDLKRSLNKMDIEKPIVLPTASACGSRGTSYSRVLGRMQTRNGAPEPPPNSRLEP